MKLKKKDFKNLPHLAGAFRHNPHAWRHTSFAEALTPQKLAGLIASANESDLHGYLTLAEEMEERDPHYASVLGTRKRAVLALEPIVVSIHTPSHRRGDEQITGSSKKRQDEASSNPKGIQTPPEEIAESVRQIVRTPQFEQLLEELLDALGKGFAVAQIHWSQGSLWQPQSYQWIDPRWFEFDEMSGEIVWHDPASQVRKPLPPYGFVVHFPRLKSGLPARGGLARLVASAFMAKSYALSDWLAFAEVFGMPLRLGKYGPKASEEDIEALVRAVSGLGSDGAAVMPASMSIEFENGNAHRGESVFQSLAEYLDKQVSKAVLGQTASSEGTPGKLGNEELQTDVFEGIIRADAKALASTLNRDLIRPFVDLNFGQQEAYPRLVLPLPDSDNLALLIEALEKLAPLGLEVEAAWVRDKFGIPDPRQGATLLGGQPTPNNEAPQKATNRTQPQEEADDLEVLREEMLAGWQPVMEPLINPIEEALSESKNYEEFLEKLPKLADSMDSTALTEALAKGLFLAKGLGHGRS